VSERDFYEALVPLAREELVRLREAEEDELRRIRIESVTSADEGTHLILVFGETSRPGCRFGWHWSWAEGPRPEELEFAAALLATNFEEDLLSDRYGLPDECEPSGAVTWV
jgi:hypothetical protein